MPDTGRRATIVAHRNDSRNSPASETFAGSPDPVEAVSIGRLRRHDASGNIPRPGEILCFSVPDAQTWCKSALQMLQSCPIEPPLCCRYPKKDLG
jgi:hypothetical protein